MEDRDRSCVWSVGEFSGEIILKQVSFVKGEACQLLVVNMLLAF
jgi:hypothetical protein